ncbi:MAG: ankyrin repeat domain-containing protein [Planctomycetes bacterium]|nr:ankyrin repeat domain-containing protein [Planctomycetota bacterium]
MGSFLRIASGAVFCALSISPIAAAHETDQFTVPVGKEFADLGDYFTAMAYNTIESAVNKTNANIRRAIETDRPAARIAQQQSPDVLTKAVFRAFTSAFFLIEDLETMVHSKRTRTKYPGRVVGYRETIRNIYQHVHFPLDPRQIFRLWHASTMKVHGTYCGPDKIGHFTDMGYHYYKAYRGARNKGLSEEEAIKRAVRVGTNGPLFAENGMVGYLSAGAYSNADLASNYAGFKFYINVTQEARIRGRMHPPMVRRDGDYWRISRHVRRDSGFFAEFITDHFNEALNPSLFEPLMRKPVRKAVEKRTANLLRWYADDNGNRRPKTYFDALTEELKTYYGEDYGHKGTHDQLITIGNTCFAEPPAGDQESGRSANGYTAIHRAALSGDLAKVKQLIDAGADVDLRVRSLENYSAEWSNTPLHIAAVSGRAEMVGLLLSHGADVNARNEHGATPLHRAIAHPEVVEMLIADGAEINAKDERGRTSLHWSARYPVPATVAALLANGADVDAQDHCAETSLHRASLWGHTDMMAMLLSAGAQVNATADFDMTPLHFAARRADAEAIKLLLRSGADIHARDEFGWTNLHDLAMIGRTGLARVLLAAGADADAVDHYGSTPLHEAARYGHDEVAALLLESGSNVNARNNSGATPLHDAGFAGHTLLVNLLLEHGADVYAKNLNGQSPVDLASSNGNRLTARLILSSSHSDSEVTRDQPIDMR